MATPKVCSDGSSAFEEAVLNKYIAAGEANKPQSKIWWGRIRYNGSSWEVVSATDSAGITTGALAWDTNQLEITLANWSNPPVVLATPAADDNANLNVKAYATSATEAVLRFYAVADGSAVTTQADTMDFNVLVIGY